MDSFLTQLTNCFSEHIGKLNLGIFPEYDLLYEAVIYAKSGVNNPALTQYYIDNLEVTGYFIDNSIVSVATTNIIKLEVPTDDTLLLGHLPVMRNAAGELYVKMPILDNI
jgi:hypothetical protein